MMRFIPWGSAAFRCTLGAVVYACALAGSLAVTGHARQAQGVADGVFTSDQAARGQQAFAAECAVCHGNDLEGGVGPMLAGDGFLGAWGGRSLAELVDKIEFTMPVQAPGSLSRAQSIDLAAYILQRSMFPAGGTALADAALSEVTFPGGAAAAPAAAGAVPVAATANLAQLMRAVTFPNANILFNGQIRDYGDERPAPPVPFEYYKWGSTVYYGWQAADQAALALIETTPLFLVPGRRCENGRPAPIDRADYQEYTQELIDVARDAYRATQTRKVEAVAEIAERLNTACANCHEVYRDAEAEGQSAGLERCM